MRSQSVLNTTMCSYGFQVDASHIYGNTKQVELALRSHVDGKMKMQVPKVYHKYVYNFNQ